MATAQPKTASDIAARVDRELLAFIADERPFVEPEALPLLSELEALIGAGGKRLRPRFCYWGHIAGGGSDSPEILRVAAALEMLHTFALIHDDVMDASPLRRSRHSTFRALAELSASVPHRGDPKRFGTSAALLTGLLGFVLADRLFNTAGFEPEVTRKAMDTYDRMRTGAIAGQYLDLLAAHRGEADEDTARRIAKLKSGGYSVVDPLVIGARFARADDETIASLKAYGEPLGEAFQLADDVLGLFGDPGVMGKDRDGDLREGKQTVLMAKARALSSPHEQRFLEEKVGDKGLSASDADKLRDIIISCGALDETKRLVRELTDAASGALDRSSIGAVAKDALASMAAEATTRDA